MSKKQAKVAPPEPVEPEVVEEVIKPKIRRKHKKPVYIAQNVTFYIKDVKSF